MEWYDVTGKYHQRTFAHNAQLSSLSEVWQRELAALWRLEADVNNGAYLQFLGNWGRETYVYASKALKKIGANQMAKIVDQCQALVDEHFEPKDKARSWWQTLLPNRVIDWKGKQIKDGGSVLPNAIVDRIYELSSEFQRYPDNLAQLGMLYYRTKIDADV